MDLMPIIGCALLGSGLVFLLIPMILRLAPLVGSNRGREFHHTHKTTVPRFGGVALAVAFVAVEVFIGMLFPHHRAQVFGRTAVITGSLLMFAIGFLDDLRPLGARKKLVGQILVALYVHYSGLGIELLTLPFSHQIIDLKGWGVVLTVLWLVGITNLINLIDGVDGLAGGISLMLMALLVYVGYQNGTFVLLTAGMSGALVGFLWFNFPPARIYLGDGGAYFVGFQIAIFSLVGSHKGSVFAALIAPLFVLALPIVDTSLAIARRGLRGLPLFRPDRRHIHHHLLATGMSRRKVVISFYAVTLVFLFLGFVAFWSQGKLVPVLLGVAALVLLLCAGKVSFAREWFAVGRTLGNSLAMRQEIQYALSLTSWLRHESDRCGSLEELFLDLVFAARRLGFTSVKVSLPDGERVWSEKAPCGGVRSFTQELHGGDGALELRGPGCLRPQICPRTQEGSLMQEWQVCPANVDCRLFEIMGELLAETWVGAATRCARDGRPLRFDAPLAAAVGAPRRRLTQPSLREPLVGAPLSQTRALGDDSAAA
jgi:UDP-GlcNAc:undecaprenyl-phosphate GlcNAc-1-phosphate transferase